MDPEKIKDVAISHDESHHIIVSSHAFGSLRKDLIHNLGIDRMKGFLIRYGWVLGVRDAEKIRRDERRTLQEKVLLGPMLHTNTGHVRARSDYIHIEHRDGDIHFQMEGTLKHSYEAEEYVRLIGKARQQVCYTLIGYASGYTSLLIGKTIIFKEVSCEATGDDFCRWVGKTAESWGAEADGFLNYFKETPIVRELEKTYDQLYIERNHLQKVANVQKQLTTEIMNGANLQRITKVIENTLQIPLIIEDNYFRTLATSIKDPTYSNVKEEFATFFNERTSLHNRHRTFRHMRMIDLKTHRRIMAPIYLQENVYGYCSFIYGANEDIDAMHKSLLERVSSACSIYLLNKRVEVETLERMKGAFLDDLIENKYENEREIYVRSNYFQLNLDEPYVFILIRNRFTLQTMQEEIAYQQKIMQKISDYIGELELNNLVSHRTNNMCILLQVATIKDKKLLQILKKMMTLLQEDFPIVQFRAGVSERGTSLIDAKSLYKQAKTAVRLATSSSEVISYDRVRLIGSLVHENKREDIIQNAKRLLNPIYTKKTKRSDETLRTLYYYLKNGRNLEATAVDASLSISGVRYRVRKIEKLLGKKLRHSAQNHEIFLTLQALRIIGELDWF